MLPPWINSLISIPVRSAPHINRTADARDGRRTGRQTYGTADVPDDGHRAADMARARSWWLTGANSNYRTDCDSSHTPRRRPGIRTRRIPPHPGCPARHGGDRRGVRRTAGRRTRREAEPGRRAGRHPHAAPGRSGGHPAARRARCRASDARGGGDDLRTRRVRPHRAAQRRLRLPAEALGPHAAGGGGARRDGGRHTDQPLPHRRPAAAPPRQPAGPGPYSRWTR